MILEMKEISKSFVGVKALEDVNFSLEKGEAHALLGENGAGKSTLMKILAGIYLPDKGEVVLKGNSVSIISPSISQQLGISIIHQELNLIPYLTVAENIFLGREPKRFGLVDYKKMVKQTVALLSQFGLELDPTVKVHTLSIGQQQVVEIAKSLSLNAEILIMDEPTAVLTEKETQNLFTIIQRLKNEGVSIIYISHRLNELKYFCDRITVLRDGKLVNTRPLKGLLEREIANLMVGRELKELYPDKLEGSTEDLLQVENFTSIPFFQNISFTLRKGEILGFAGLIGAGRSELASAIFGALKPNSGKLTYKNKHVSFTKPKAAVKEGFGFATEDRKQTGLVLEASISQNMTLPILDKISKWSLVQKRKEKVLVSQKIHELGIKIYDINQPVKHLSGGNQQKVVIAKWLLAGTELFILDEPTRGIDIGAKAEIYSLIHNLAKSGKGVIVISSELPELLGLCSRIIVMNKGTIAGELKHNEATEEAIMALATGV
ncbi:sugar ABC transporter ATP-binding protein [Bacillus sp. S/N-304-OC-R1]|uniref:sugar ABC transporter ATP-binding protein n=1 Tax=Bacillus sp. S/N-304-OC-R1 TaxID=2758034 RepID=UPI001C8EECB4|nr:sugar ABC transporter ATP-binding protein [Bacillus sp. S/N-304-OC-R1]MBY0124551.1 sugar ABC transporter ATP-binding protein [Bacillus sp. S/N-304-OC-R1]